MILSLFFAVLACYDDVRPIFVRDLIVLEWILVDLICKQDSLIACGYNRNIWRIDQ